ncbi:hypothetical protein FACS1894109_12270 [Spirochaetia bacterium]|nr:hypothetical protein FACS1894109_12270 [Spirochaetia bacterium]
MAALAALDNQNDDTETEDEEEEDGGEKMEHIMYDPDDTDHQAEEITGIDFPDGITAIYGDFNENEITELVFPDSITRIEVTFSYNPIEHIQLPPRLAFIGAEAFLENQLSEIDIPDSVTEIEAGAFCNNQLTYAAIPSKLEYIAENLFADNQLDTVEFPANGSLVQIDGGAFFNNRLEEIALPDTIKWIGNGAFGGNPLTSITIGAGVQPFDSAPQFAENTFGDYGESFIAAYDANGKKAGTYAYDEESGAWSIDGDDTGSAVEKPAPAMAPIPQAAPVAAPAAVPAAPAAGTNCAKCGAPVSAGAKFCPSCGTPVAPATAFCPQCGAKLASGAQFCSSCGTKLSAAPVPQSPAPVPQAPAQTPPVGPAPPQQTAVVNPVSNPQVVNGVLLFPPGTTVIGNYEKQLQIEKAVIPEGVTDIATCAFEGCKNLKSVSIPGSAITTGWGTFRFCPITELSLGEGITEIGQESFWPEHRLTNIIIPSSVRKIKSSAFWTQSHKIESITLGDKVSVYAGAVTSKLSDAVNFDFTPDYKAQGQKAGTYIFHENAVKTDKGKEVHWLLKK